MKHIGFVPENGLCTGCGACTGICPVNAITPVWDKYGDRVPEVDSAKCISCGLCVKVCPGYKVDYKHLNLECHIQESDTLKVGVGSCKSCDIIYTENRESFQEATSGGVVRELLATLIEKGEINGVLMITAQEKLSFPFYAPYKVFTDPDEIRKHKVHSRYCPAPLLEGLKEIESDDKVYAIVTLPCHTHAIRNLQAEKPVWKKKLKYLFGLICSGTPTANANAYLFADNGVDETTLDWVDYRYGEWPKGVYGRDNEGKMHNVRKMGGLKEQNRLFQMIGMVYMSPYFWRRRCLFCADFFNQYADIACGDPWVRKYWKGSIKDGLKGGTLTIIRTEHVQKLVDEMLAAGKLDKRMEVEPDDIHVSMGVFQHKRIKPFESYKKHVHKFNMEFPDHQHFENPYNDLNKREGYFNLLKSQLTLKRSRWWIFKYIQFVEEGFAFIKRKIKREIA